MQAMTDEDTAINTEEQTEVNEDTAINDDDIQETTEEDMEVQDQGNDSFPGDSVLGNSCSSREEPGRRAVEAPVTPGMSLGE